MLLLHGLSSDATSYMRFTSIERYAEAHQLAVIMPNADHSGYANMAFGHSYYDYILEIYNYAHQVLPVSKKEKIILLQVIQWGYGTMKFALTQSHLFSKAAPLSAVFDVKSLLDIEWNDFDPKAIAGEALKVKGTELDTII